VGASSSSVSPCCGHLCNKRCSLATEIGGGLALVPETTHAHSVAYSVALLYGEASLEAEHAATSGGLQVST